MNIEKLLLSRFLLKKGESFIDSEDAMSSGLAISLFQDSAELVLWTIASSLEVNVGERDGFTKIWELINKNQSGKQTLPFKEKMFEINKARIGFKHYGILPDPSLAFNYYGFTTEFIKTCIDTYFGIDYEKISLADLIKNDEIRNNLKEGEEKLRNGEYKQALVLCEVANIKIFRLLENVLPETPWDLDDFGEKIRHIDEQEDLRLEWSQIVDFLKGMRSTIAISIIGAKINDFLKYRKIAPHVNITIGGQVHSSFYSDIDSEKDVQFCLDFVIDTALKAESRVL